MIAIIDIGSNSVRLAIFSDGNIIFRDKITARLGQGFYQTGEITQEALNRNVEAVCTLLDLAKLKGVSKNNVYLFATATVRDAKNGKAFCDQIYAITGLLVDILSETEEAKCALLGALGDKNGAVVDLGGGSIELISSSCGAVDFSHSINMGVVKITDMFGCDKLKTQAYVKERLFEYGNVKIDSLIGVGGSATCCAFILSGDKDYDINKNHGRLIEKQKLFALVDKLYGMTASERSKEYNVSPKRAETIHAGALVLALLLDYLGLESLTVSERDNLDGYYSLKVVNSET